MNKKVYIQYLIPVWHEVSDLVMFQVKHKIWEQVYDQVGDEVLYKVYSPIRHQLFQLNLGIKNE